MAQLFRQWERKKVLCSMINAMQDALIVWTVAVATELIVTTDYEADFEDVEAINPLRAAS